MCLFNLQASFNILFCCLLKTAVLIEGGCGEGTLFTLLELVAVGCRARPFVRAASLWSLRRRPVDGFGVDTFLLVLVGSLAIVTLSADNGVDSGFPFGRSPSLCCLRSFFFPRVLVLPASIHGLGLLPAPPTADKVPVLP